MRVEVDEEYVKSVAMRQGGQVDADRGFSRAAFLGQDRNNWHMFKLLNTLLFRDFERMNG